MGIKMGKSATRLDLSDDQDSDPKAGSSPLALLGKLRKDKSESAKGERARTKNAKSSKWRLRTVINHVTFVGDGGVGSEDRMIAWYLMDPQQWSFRSRAEGNALITDYAGTLAELVGSTIHIRCTTRPYPVAAWAKAAWENAPEPQAGWAQVMERDQRHMAASAQVDKLVYVGVDLGQRGIAVSLLGKVSSGVIDREMQALQDRLDATDTIMSGPGVEARPVTDVEMEWLLAKSFALGCPVPVPGPDEPTQSVLDGDDLDQFVKTVDWSAEPLAPATQIVANLDGKQVTRYVVVLTVSRIADVKIPEEHPPWMSKTDQMPFPVEWSARVEMRTPEEISKDMTRQSNRVDGQIAHWSKDHGKQPPKQLARQARRTQEVEDEMRTGFTGLSTRTKAWFRIAVSGRTEEEATERAAALVQHYKPQIQLVREMGQYALAREFVPGEPLSTTAHARRFPILKVAAGLPQITAEVGDKRGVHIGETAGLTARAVTHDPWYLPEVMESGGLVPLVGTLGSGKSMLMGMLAYKFVNAGVYGVALDPAGRLQKLIQMPEMRKIGHSVDVLGGMPGSLAPYAVVPDASEQLVRLDCINPDDPAELRDRMRRAQTAAEATRRDLCFQTLRQCLPFHMARNPEVQTLLHNAIRQEPAHANSSLQAVIGRLRNAGPSAQERSEIADMLVTASERELGRLFFHEPDQDRDVQLVSQARFTVFNVKGLVHPDPDVDQEDYSPDEMLARPILTLASWASVNLIYRRDPHERKLFLLDEAQEITDKNGPGRTLVTKVATDSRKNNTVAYVSTQNASTVLGQNINNFAGAAFVGRTADEEAQRAALRLLGKPENVGYESLLGNLSRRRRSGEELPYREFIYRDGLGGEGGRGGMEKIRVSLKHHPELFQALNTTPGGRITRREDELVNERIVVS